MRWNVKFRRSGLSFELRKKRPIPGEKRNACTSPSCWYLWIFRLFWLASHVRRPWWSASLERTSGDSAVYRSFFAFILFISTKEPRKWSTLDVYRQFFWSLPSFRFPVSHRHNSCEKRSWLPGQRSCGASLQVRQSLFYKVETHPWMNLIIMINNANNDFLAKSGVKNYFKGLSCEIKQKIKSRGRLSHDFSSPTAIS